MRPRFSATFAGTSREPTPPLSEEYTPSDTPPDRVKKACRIPGRVAREEACSIDHRDVVNRYASSTDRTDKTTRLARRSFETGRRTDGRMHESRHFKQFPHGSALAADQARQGLVDIIGLCRFGLE